VNSFLTWLLDSENLATAIVNVLRSFHTARKGTKFAGSVGHKLIKMLSASSPLDQGLCPGTPLRAEPPDPRYWLALRSRHVLPASKRNSAVPLFISWRRACRVGCKLTW